MAGQVAVAGVVVRRAALQVVAWVAAHPVAAWAVARLAAPWVECQAWAGGRWAASESARWISGRILSCHQTRLQKNEIIYSCPQCIPASGSPFLKPFQNIVFYIFTPLLPNGCPE